MVEYNKIIISSFWQDNCSVYVQTTERARQLLWTVSKKEGRVHKNSYRTTLRIYSLSLYKSWLASGSLWTLILVIKSSIASLLPTCHHCVICKSNILFEAVWHSGLLHITEVSCFKVISGSRRGEGWGLTDLWTFGYIVWKCFKVWLLCLLQFIGHVSAEGYEFLSLMDILCICLRLYSIHSSISSVLYLYQIWKASREGYAASLRATKISSTSSCTGTANQIKTMRAWTHQTGSNKHVLLKDFCYQTVPRILYASSSHAFCDKAKKKKLQLRVYKYSAMATLDMQCILYVQVNHALLLQVGEASPQSVVPSPQTKNKNVCLMGVCKTPTFFFFFFPIFCFVSMGWAQGFRIEETLEIFELFPWKYLSVIH